MNVMSGTETLLPYLKEKGEELACAYFENRFLTIRAAVAETRNSASNGMVVNSGITTPQKVNVRGLCGEGSDPKWNHAVNVFGRKGIGFTNQPLSAGSVTVSGCELT
jgi:hypothetical protein